MSIEKFVEEQVRKAIEAGEFDNLPGKGKPIDLRVASGMELALTFESAGMRPPNIQQPK